MFHKFGILFLAAFIPLFLYSLGYEVYTFVMTQYPIPVSFIIYSLLGQNLASLVICGLVTLIVVQFTRHKNEISPYVLWTAALVQGFLICLSAIAVALRSAANFSGLVTNLFLQVTIGMVYAIFVYAQTRKSDRNYGADELIDSINAEKE